LDNKGIADLGNPVLQVFFCLLTVKRKILEKLWHCYISAETKVKNWKENTIYFFLLFFFFLIWTLIDNITLLEPNVLNFVYRRHLISLWIISLHRKWDVECYTCYFFVKSWNYNIVVNYVFFLFLFSITRVADTLLQRCI
jgi:hypothetical protein